LGAAFPGTAAAVEGLVQGLGVAAGGLRPSGLERQLDEAGAEALHLLLHRRTDIVRIDHGAEATRCGDRLQTGNTGANHQYSRRARVPAAVVNIGNSLGRAVAASSTAR
jgi:hypothetical protein